MSNWLWDEVHYYFDTDDGSLPTIEVEYHRPAAAAQGYALLRDRAAPISTTKATFWSKVRGVACPVDSVPDPASLVASGDAEAFHVLFTGLRFGDNVVPDLGVFVFADALALDYRMGSSWGPMQVASMFKLLLDLAALDPRASVHFKADASGAFERAWQRYQSEHAA